MFLSLTVISLSLFIVQFVLNITLYKFPRTNVQYYKIKIIIIHIKIKVNIVKTNSNKQ